MIVTIIPSDQVVIVDGVALVITSGVTYPSNTNAIQWDGTSGVKELVGTAGIYTETFTNISEIQSFIDEHNNITSYVPTTYWNADGTEGTLEYGETLPPGAVTTKNLAAYKLDLDATALEKLNLNLTIDSRGIYNDSVSYNDMTAQAMSTATNIMLQLTDGTFHTYTKADFTTMWNKVNEYRQLCVTNKDAKTTALNGAADPSTVDLTVGWPTTTMTTT